MKNKMKIVKIHDRRSGHDSCINEGFYGRFLKLLVKPKAGALIQNSVFLVSDKDKGTQQSGNRLNNQTVDLTTVFAINTEMVEWACVLRGYDAQTMLSGKSSGNSWEEIPGLPGGPKVRLQKFLKAYPRWVEENVGHATEWLEQTARRLGKNDVLDAIACVNRKQSKNLIDSAWREVKKLLDVPANWNNSWTAVRSAPFKIAMAVQKKYKDSWNLNGSYAFRFKGERPIHPGEANGYVALPSYNVKLREFKT